MPKRFLKGVALGGLLGGLLVWMHTTPKGKNAKQELNKRLAVLWKKIENEYVAANPDGVEGWKREAKAALRSWKKKDVSGDVSNALQSFLKKIG